jgi:hypothetical protein
VRDGKEVLDSLAGSGCFKRLSCRSSGNHFFTVKAACRMWIHAKGCLHYLTKDVVYLKVSEWLVGLRQRLIESNARGKTKSYVGEIRQTKQCELIPF